LKHDCFVGLCLLHTLFVAFTPKGGCPLKHGCSRCTVWNTFASSIHPQGWVPIETVERAGFYW